MQFDYLYHGSLDLFDPARADQSVVLIVNPTGSGVTWEGSLHEDIIAQIDLWAWLGGLFLAGLIEMGGSTLSVGSIIYCGLDGPWTV